MSNIYTIRCTNHKRPVEFTYSVDTYKWLKEEIDSIYEYYKDGESGEGIRINYVRCPECHTSSVRNLGVVTVEKGE